jgi:hypothetical protein
MTSNTRADIGNTFGATTRVAYSDGHAWRVNAQLSEDFMFCA